MGNSEMIIYKTEDGLSQIDVTFDGDTVWLLNRWQTFSKGTILAISRHIKNIFSEGELDRTATVAKFATVP